MEQRPRGRSLTAASFPREGGAAGERVLSHERPQGAASLREAGDEAMRFRLSVPVPTVPVKPCGCQVCLIAASRAPNANRGQLSACESIRRKRKRYVVGVGHCTRDAGEGFRLEDLARFLRVSRETARMLGRQLKLLKKPEGDHRYAPLTRRQAKRLIQACRAKDYGPRKP